MEFAALNLETITEDRLNMLDCPFQSRSLAHKSCGGPWNLAWMTSRHKSFGRVAER